MSTPSRNLVIDLSSAHTEETLHDILAEELGFFDGYGRNFDAFWDCITDDRLSAMPANLIVEGLGRLSKTLPNAHRLLVECLNQYQEGNSEKSVLLVDGKYKSSGG